MDPQLKTSLGLQSFPENGFIVLVRRVASLSSVINLLLVWFQKLAGDSGLRLLLL